MQQVLCPDVVFDSKEMPAAVAIDAWHDIANSTVQIDIDRDDRDRFAMLLLAIRLDQTVATSSRTTAQTFHRNLAQVNRDGHDQYGFFLQVRGSRQVRTNGVDVLLAPGDLQFVDMAQEDRSIASDGLTSTLYVPRNLVEADVPEAARLHGTVIRNSAAQVFAHQLLSLFDAGNAWSPIMTHYFERSLLSMAIGCLVESQVHAPESTHSAVEQSIRRRIERFIEDNLADHDLDASRIVQEFGASRSVIYRVFQVHGGLTRYIFDCRLRRVRRLLLEGDERTIWELAHACGFVSPAHFSRQFRRTFGVTPSEIRRRQPIAGQRSLDTSSLDRLLRSIAH